MKILNLYAGIGGNRKLWGDEHEVTAVEIDPNIAVIYKSHFPNDNLFVGDAHQYLLEHFEEFDFIWSSPPCPSHSHIRKELAVEAKGQNKPIFPDMKLYEEILLLQGYFKGRWVVENVISWYEPLIKPFKVANHFFWSNFVIPKITISSRNHMGTLDELKKRKGFDLEDVKEGVDKRKLLRNCVEPELGLHIFEMAFKKPQKELFSKTTRVISKKTINKFFNNT